MISKKRKTVPGKKAAKVELLRTPKGMHDVLPSMQPWYDRVRMMAGEVAALHNFGRIDTPLVEFAQLFERGVGEATDIVEKEMYVFRTRGGGGALALRPEGTAAVMRAYLQHQLGRSGQPQRLYYEGPMFRHENPQAGRYRQHLQIGFEIVGGQDDSLYDVEAIATFSRFFKLMKFKQVLFAVNSIGCRACRPLYKRQLQSYYRQYERKLCVACTRRLKENPLRLLDCKDEQCQEPKEEAPNILDKLCDACCEHLKGVLEYLDEFGMHYTLDNTLVRGLDYYNRTVFEVFVEGDQTGGGSLGGGGRYDYLAEMLGGPETPAVGGSIGVERVIEAAKFLEITAPQHTRKAVFFVHVGEKAKGKSLVLIEQLRDAGIYVKESLGKESLKGQLKSADREGVRWALILGQKEMFDNGIIIRDLATSLQETISLDNMVEEVKRRLRQPAR